MLGAALAGYSAMSLGADGTASESEATRISEECCVWAGGLVGPGSMVVQTLGDIQFSIGMNARVIPTTEYDWDFGIGNNLPDGATIGGFSKDIFSTHFSEAGVLSGDYIRNQLSLYLNILPENRTWSTYIQLQTDQALDIRTLDNAAGAGNFQSDFGVERFHSTALLPMRGNVRLHAGWDYWELDTIEGPGLAFGDDAVGVWFTGQPSAKIDWNAGYFVLREQNAGGGGFDSIPFGDQISDSTNNDRDMFAGYLNYHFDDHQKIRAFYAFDNIQDNPVQEMNGVLFGAGNTVVGARNGTDAQIHNLGAYYKGTFGNLEVFGEGIYKVGEVKNTGLTGVVAGGREDYDVNAYAAAAYLRYELKDKIGGNMKSFKPALMFMHTSGDDDAEDGNLEGYTAVMADQRFSQWGSENSFMTDTHWVMGTPVFGFLPEALGNGTPVFTGGIENFSGLGFGRGDNPGVTIVTLGLTAQPWANIVYSTKAHAVWWNEDFVVTNVVSGGGNARTTVGSGYAGTEWGNELTVGINKNMAAKFQASWFFAGDGVEDLTEALATKSDETAQRYAVELVWSF